MTMPAMSCRPSQACICAGLACAVLAMVWPQGSPQAQQTNAGQKTGTTAQGKVRVSPPLQPPQKPAPADTGPLPQKTPETTAPAGNATVLSKSPADPKAAQGNGGQVTLQAHLVEHGQRIEHGLVWRIFQDKPQADGKFKLVSQHREASPVIQLPAGEYQVNVAYGRTHLTRRIAVLGDTPLTERFVLNAGGLRLSAAAGPGEPALGTAVGFDIFSDERDQAGNRIKIMSGAKPGVIVRLNSGIYHIVSTYGDANAIVRADVTVEAGKLTEATVTHAAAKVTFKLVARAGGEALADTHWIIAAAGGSVVKESVGALPTHTLAPGSYSVTAKASGRAFRRDFTVKAGEITQVEVVMQ